MDIFDIITAQVRFINFEEGFVSLTDGVVWNAVISNHGPYALSITDPDDAAGAMAEADSYWLSQGHKRITPWSPGDDYSCFVAI